MARRAAEKAAVEVQRAAEQRVADEQKRAAEEQAEKRSPKRPASPDTKALLQEQAEKIARLEAQLRAAQTPPSRPKPKLKRKPKPARVQVQSQPEADEGESEAGEGEAEAEAESEAQAVHAYVRHPPFAPATYALPPYSRRGRSSRPRRRALMLTQATSPSGSPSSAESPTSVDGSRYQLPWVPQQHSFPMETVQGLMKTVTEITQVMIPVMRSWPETQVQMARMMTAMLDRLQPLPPADHPPASQASPISYPPPPSPSHFVLPHRQTSRQHPPTSHQEH